MQSQKLFVITAIVSLMMGASGLSMAEDNTCPGGTIEYITVEGNLVVTDQSCYVKIATIKGNVIVDNIGSKNAQFVLRDSIVSGNVNVTGGQAIIEKSQMLSILLKVVETSDTVVSHNLLLLGSMVFSDNGALLVYKNIVPVGDIRCIDNVNLQKPRELAKDNLVPFGEITCYGQ